MNTKIVLLVLSFTFLAVYSQAQIYAYAGAHRNFVRTKRIQGAAPIQSLHFGAAVNVFLKDESKRHFITYDIGYIEKGYDQTLGQEKFVFRFQYITTQLTANYPLLSFLTIRGGINGAFLVYSNADKWMKKYSPIDIGFVAGLNLFENKRIGLYSQIVYGITPMINYYDIDAQGNFNGRLYELRNTSIMVGVKVDVYGDKVRF